MWPMVKGDGHDGAGILDFYARLEEGESDCKLVPTSRDAPTKLVWFEACIIIEDCWFVFGLLDMVLLLLTRGSGRKSTGLH